jgi:hypothetical protein
VTRAELENKVRAWLAAAGAAGGVPSADSAVVIADQDGTRPPLPYLLVRVLVPEVQVGEDETLVDDADPPQIRVRGQRYATVGVQAFGEEALSWLRRATRKLASPSIVTLNQAAGVAIRPQGGPTNLSGLRDSHTEVRFSQDFRVDFEVLSTEDEAESGVPLEQVVDTHEWTSQDGSPDRTEVVTIVLPP